MLRFCSFCFRECGSATEAQLKAHLDTHPQEVADARYWGAVNSTFAAGAGAADGKEDAPRSVFEAELWHDFVQATEDTRQTAEEAAQKHAGMHFLQGLLQGRAVCIPFGSSVIGTAELGQSDTDVSVYMPGEAPKFYVSEMLGLHRRDAMRLRDLKAEIEQTTGAYIYVGHLESMVGSGAVLADTADAVFATLDLIRSGLRQFHERAGIMRPTNPTPSTLSEHMVLCWAHDQFATSLACRPKTMFELLLRTHVPISRMTTEGTALEDGMLHFQDEECRTTFLAFVQEERRRAGDEDAFACNDGASLVFEKPGDALELFQRLQQKQSKERARVAASLRRGETPPVAGDDVYRLCHCSVKIAVPTSLKGKWDITARPHYGPRNSTLLKRILQSAGEPAFVACSMIKKWGKVHGVSNSRAGFLSSYALVLMFCFYLQRAGHAKYVEHTSVHHASQLSACPVPQRLSQEERLVCRDLLLGFFRFYTHFDWSKHAVTLRVAPSEEVTSEELGFTLAKVITKLRGHKKDHSHVLMVVHDPYEEVNCTRRISYPKFLFVSALFRASYALLSAEDTSQLAQLRLQRVLGQPFHADEEGPESRIPVDLLPAEAVQRLSEGQSSPADEDGGYQWHDAYIPRVGETIMDPLAAPSQRLQEHTALERGWTVTADGAGASQPRQHQKAGPAAPAPAPAPQRNAVPTPQWQKRPPTTQTAPTAQTAQNWQAPRMQLHPRPATVWPAPTTVPAPQSPTLQGQPAYQTNTSNQPAPRPSTVPVQTQPVHQTYTNSQTPPLQSSVLQGPPAYQTNTSKQPSVQQNKMPVHSQPVYQTSNPTPAQPSAVPAQGQTTYQTNAQLPNAVVQPSLQQSMVLQGQPTRQTSTSIQPPPSLLQGQPPFQVGNSNPQRVVLVSQPAPSGAQAQPQTLWVAQAQPQVQVQPQANGGLVHRQ